MAAAAAASGGGAGPASAPASGGAVSTDAGKLYSIVVMFRPPGPPNESAHAFILAQAYEVSDFLFIYRSNVREYLTMGSRALAKRTPPGNRVAVKYMEYIGYCVTRPDGFCCVIMCDEKYPSRVALSLALRVATEFGSLYAGKFDFTSLTSDRPFEYGPLTKYLSEYQKPSAADPLMRTQALVDDTRQILVQTMESLLERERKLEDLIKASADLSSTSKNFYGKAKSLNCRCVLL